MLDAGKYAGFVWPAYGLSALVLAGAVGEALLRARRWRRAVQAREGERLRRATSGPPPGPGSGSREA